MTFKERYDKTKNEVIEALIKQGYSELDARNFTAMDYEFGYDSVEEILEQIEEEKAQMREMLDYL